MARRSIQFSIEMEKTIIKEQAKHLAIGDPCSFQRMVTILLIRGLAHTPIHNIE